MIIVKQENAPKGYALDFEKWFKQADVLGLDGFKEFIETHLGEKNIEVDFSDECISEEVGYYTVQNVKDFIKEMWKTNEEIQKHLDQINTKEDFVNSSLELSKMISNYNEVDLDDVHGSLHNLIKNIKTLKYVYSSHGIFNKITLYPNTFKNINSPFEQVCELAFITEVFHLFYRYRASHYKCPDYLHNDGFERNDYIAKMIKSSLALQNAYKYSYKYNLDKHYFVKYLSFDFHNIPEAGFSLLVDNDDFIEVYNNSLSNMDEALRYMLRMSNLLLYDFYNRK